MRVRSHRRNLVVWSSSAAPASRSGDRGCTRLARGGRIRWWLRTGGLLTVFGVMLPSVAAFVCGMLVWAIARPWHA